MLLTRVVKCPRRLIGWSVFLLALAGIGWGLYAGLPAQPRWVIRGPIAPSGLAPDGKTLRTETRRPEQLPSLSRSRRIPVPEAGPVRFWDVETGREVLSVLGENGPRWRVVYSSDGKRLAAIEARDGDPRPEVLRCIDLEGARESQPVLLDPTARWIASFSKDSDLLLLEDPDEEQEFTDLLLYDADSLRLLARTQTRNRLPKWNHWPRWQWSADGKALLVFSTEKTEGNASLRRISRGAETVVHFKGAGDWLAVTPDGKTLLTEPHRTGLPELAPLSSILLWELDTGKPRGTIDVSDVHPRAGENLLFAPDGRTLVLIHGKPRPGDFLGLWDMENAKWLGDLHLDQLPVCPVFLDQNGLAPHSSEGPACLEWYRIRPFGRLWQRQWAGRHLQAVSLAAGAKRLLVMPGLSSISAELEALDVETGETCVAIALEAADYHEWITGGQYLALSATHDGTPTTPGPIWEIMKEQIVRPLLGQPRQGSRTRVTTRVVDLETGAEVGRLEHTEAGLVHLSRDGRSLILYHEAGETADAVLCCYDIPPRRAAPGSGLWASPWLPACCSSRCAPDGIDCSTVPQGNLRKESRHAPESLLEAPPTPARLVDLCARNRGLGGCALRHAAAGAALGVRGRAEKRLLRR
jgi:WD40 repeat protein